MVRGPPGSCETKIPWYGAAKNGAFLLVLAKTRLTIWFSARAILVSIITLLYHHGVFVP